MGPGAGAEIRQGHVCTGLPWCCPPQGLWKHGDTVVRGGLTFSQQGEDHQREGRQPVGAAGERAEVEVPSAHPGVPQEKA